MKDYAGVTSQKREESSGPGPEIHGSYPGHNLFFPLSLPSIAARTCSITFRRESHSFCQDSISTFGPSPCWAGPSPLASSTLCLSCRLKNSDLFKNFSWTDVVLTPDSIIYCIFWARHLGASNLYCSWA